MGNDLQSRKLVVILHADVVGSTILVQLDEAIAHKRIRLAFDNFSKIIKSYGGIAHEIRGDAVVAEFELTTDAINASLAFQAHNQQANKSYSDDIRPLLRIGISLGEVIVADNTLTGSGVVMAQRLEQLADPAGIVVQGSIHDTVPKRMPYWFESLGEQELKGFDQPIKSYAVTLRQGEVIPKPELRKKPKGAMTGTPRTAKVGMSLLGMMMVVLIVLGVLILQLKPPEVDTMDFLAEKTEQVVGDLKVRFEWIPVLFQSDSSGTVVGQRQATDKKLSIVEVEGAAGSERIASEKIISGSADQEEEVKRAAEEALMLAQLELEQEQKAIEDKRKADLARKQAEEKRLAEEKRQSELARKLAEEKQLAELKRKEAEEKRLAELKRKQAEEKRLAELKRKQAEEKRLAELKRKQAEEKRLAELKRKQDEERRLAELKRKAEEERQQAELAKQEAEKQKQIQSLLSSADLHFDNGDYTKALLDYQKVLALNPAETEKQRARQRMENSEVALLVLKRSDLILLFHDVRGTYSSEISTTEGNSRYALGKRSKEVKLKQNKDKITGTFSGDRSGEIEGIIDEDTIKFKWFVSGGGYFTQGSGEWKVINDGLNLNGMWRRKVPSSTRGNWNLTKTE